MNLKTRVFGLAAGAILSLSLITGVGAQATTSTTLKPATGSCVAAATSGSIDLGTWNWNAATKQYDYVAPAASGLITTMVTQAIQPNINCNVTLTVSDLTGPEGSTITGVTDVVAPGSSATGSGGKYSVPTSAQGARLEVAATLPAVPENAAPGVYTGTITVDSSSAAS
jgi:hypothetical protein